MHDWYKIQAKGKKGEIFIYDQIGFDPWTGEGVSASQFIKDMKALDGTDEITVRINSPGGSVFDGTAIQSQLVQAKQKITVRIDGIAASAASFIAMAGDEIIIPENAMMMIHNASAMTWGDIKAHREQIDALERVGAAMRSTYVKRTGLSDTEIQDMLDATTWMDGKEAVSMGFADTLESPVRIAACAEFNSVMKHMNVDVPEWVHEKFATSEGARRSQDCGSKLGEALKRIDAIRATM